MRNLILSATCVLCFFLVFSCKKNESGKTTGTPATIEDRTVQKTKGKDCGKVDSLRTDCAIIDFSVPKIKTGSGSPALAKAVDAWADKYLIGLLTYSDYPESDASKALPSVDAAIKRFHEMHDDAEGSVMAGQFAAKTSYETLLNDGQYLTLQINGFSFQGGNHAMEDDVEIGSFDMSTGRQYNWDGLVKDKAAFFKLAEQKFREARADDFDKGFKFDNETKFAMPGAYGLTADGLLMQYVDNEIYGISGPTSIVVPYNELGKMLRVAAPKTATAEAGDDLEIYEADGDSLIIPTFEIEVSNSAAADNTLTKKKETILVDASFSGEPLNEKDADDMGMFITEHQVELSGDNRIARFEGIKFHKKTLAKLVSKDINLLINVYSGRKSTQDNQLTCAILDKKASEFANKRFVLNCQLISEPVKVSPNMMNPAACYALPELGEAPIRQISFLVNCDSVGNISFAETPMKDLDALKAALRPLLKDWVKKDAKNLPGIETEGCMMGNSGAIRDMYEELTAELTGTAKPTEMEKGDDKINKPKGGDEKNAVKPGSTTKPAKDAKPATKPATTPTISPTKSAPANSGIPTVTLKQSGDMLLNGKAVSGSDQLRKQLQAALLAQATIPDKLELKTEGKTGMGARAEVNTIINESIAGAKWVRKKAAIAALNTAVGKKLGTSTQLELGSYQTNGNFAFISAKLKGADGKAIDFSKTEYAKDKAAGKFTENAIGLLQYDKGAWKVLTYSIGVTKPPVDAWVKNYKASKALFGK